jgi:hypothetical protein
MWIYVFFSKTITENGGKMRTLSVAISEIEYNKFGIANDKLAFSDFIDLVSRELMRQNLNACVSLAERYGLSSMTMEEITSEVKAVRHEKNHY